MLEVDFTNLYTQMYAQVLRMCRAYCGNAALAKDLAQESFMRAWQAKHQFKGEAKVKTWMYRIAVNTCLAYLRSPKNKPFTELPEHMLNVADTTDAAEKEKQLQQMYDAIYSLPPADRLLTAMLLNKLPYADMAAVLHVTEQNLRVKIHRVKKELTNKIESNANLS